MRNWFEWGRLEAGGCVLVGSVTEYDDRPGPMRDLGLRNEQRWRDELQRAAQLALDCGHLRDGDTDTYASRTEEHKTETQLLLRIPYSDFCCMNNKQNQK